MSDHGDAIQVVLVPPFRVWFEAVIAREGWSLFPIPWEKDDGTLTLEPRPDDLPTFGIRLSLPARQRTEEKPREL